MCTFFLENIVDCSLIAGKELKSSMLWEHREVWGTRTSSVSYDHIYQTMHSAYIYHIFIHSFVDGHLDFLHVLAVVNGAAMNTGVHVSF